MDSDDGKTVWFEIDITTATTVGHETKSDEASIQSPRPVSVCEPYDELIASASSADCATAVISS